jgi:hypothetical protein
VMIVMLGALTVAASQRSSARVNEAEGTTFSTGIASPPLLATGQ